MEPLSRRVVIPLPGAGILPGTPVWRSSLTTFLVKCLYAAGIGRTTLSFHSSDHRAIKLVQLSDCHLGQNDQFVLAGINTAESLKAVVSRLEGELAQSDLLAITGDIAADGERAAYQLFEKLLPEHPPFAWLPGNHDDFNVMQQFMSQPFQRVVKIGRWVAVFLVSAVPGQVAGKLAAAELALLEKLLAEYRQYHVALFVHHPPAPVDCRWLDKQRIENHQSLRQLLQGADNVRGVFSGHVHQDYVSDWGGVPVYTAPSTCFQFAPASDDFELCRQPPGYRWINLHEDGSIETGVEFIDGDNWQADRHCVG
ncbi:MAG: hypothetical protein EP323_07415, partial [Gammaproteobacteria bacterium]